MSEKIPLLFVSDAPTAGTGLSRITRDLATRVHEHIPEFQVGCFGYGGSYTSKLPFPQYYMDMQDWVLFNLPEVWDDFAGTRKGILFVIWDASRLLWLSRPENCPNPMLKRFLDSKPFETWTYTPMDATGPNDKLTTVLGHTLEGFDRVLAYSEWARGILHRTSPKLDYVEALPHGLDASVFKPIPRRTARHGFGQKMGVLKQDGKPFNIPDDALLIGAVGTNQIRKDWGQAFELVYRLGMEHNVLFWCHTDQLENKWSIPGLANDYGLVKRTIITTVPFSDEQMAWAYSACDLTLGIGLGEGFGYPIFESIMCGTPCFHGAYGGAPENMEERFLIEPLGYRLEGAYSTVRPVFETERWQHCIELNYKDSPKRPDHLDWDVLWPRWEAFFRKGIK